MNWIGGVLLFMAGATFGLFVGYFAAAAGAADALMEREWEEYRPQAVEDDDDADTTVYPLTAS